ncbi:MAG TPA: ABC transporter permease [Acidimicrobiales bacterium]|nr:ABC transporter permease [Acidimicrobiales bacterium]
MSEARLIDTGYHRYDGPRLGEWHSTVALWKHTLRRIFGLGRPARWKLLPIASVAIAYVPNIVFVGVTALIPDDRLRNSVLPGYAFTYGFIPAAIALFVIFVAPEAICPDRRSGILSLYLATPLTRSRYIAAKGAAVFTALLTVTLGPALLYLIGLAAQNAGPHGFGSFMSTLGKIVVVGVVMAAYFAAFSVGASSLTDRKAVAAAIIFFFSQAVGVATGVLVSSFNAPKWLVGFSPNAAPIGFAVNMFHQGNNFRIDNYIVPMSAFASAVALWAAVGAAIAWFRYTRLRVTR